MPLIAPSHEVESIDSIEMTGCVTPNTENLKELESLLPSVHSLDEVEDRSRSHSQTNPSISSPSLPSFKCGYYPFFTSEGITDATFLYSKYLSPLSRKLIVLSLLFILCILLTIFIYIYEHNYILYDRTNYYNQDSSTPIQTYRITFLGDSLINIPKDSYDLFGRLQRHFKTINLNITDHTIGGNLISHMRKTVHKDVPPHSADMVILFWDSDISDLFESQLTSEEIQLKRQTYFNDIIYVINAVKEAGVPYIAIAGPTVLGGGLCCDSILPVIIRNKREMLKDYLQMNQEAAKSLNIPYINIHQLFTNAIPFYWFLATSRVTYDGENPNYRGTGIIAYAFAKQISQWTHAPVTP